MIVDRRRSDTDALNSMYDVKLIRQKLLKYAHVQSQDSADSDTTIEFDEDIKDNKTSNGNVHIKTPAERTTTTINNSRGMK